MEKEDQSIGDTYLVSLAKQVEADKSLDREVAAMLEIETDDSDITPSEK